MAAQCKLFLKKFQTYVPLARCVYNAIGQLLHTLMKRFVKKLILEKADGIAQLLKIDVTNKDTRCNYREVDVGMAGNKEMA